MLLMELGQIVRQNNEIGVVVHLSPPFMRLTNMGCYVLVHGSADVIGRMEEWKPPNRGVIDRIRRYVEARDAESCTGEGCVP